RFPGGRVIVLSAVGFNHGRDRAMVSVQRNCILKEGRVGCEEVHTVGLRKKNGRWDPSRIGCHGGPEPWTHGCCCLATPVALKRFQLSLGRRRLSTGSC